MRGNTGTGPLKTLDDESLAAGGQRWRFIPLHKRLSNTSARPATFSSLEPDPNLEDLEPDDTSFSHFAAALTASSETNITATFSNYLQQVRPLCHSLPLIYRNRKKIITVTLHVLQSSTRNSAEATPALATCLTALSKDLGPQHFHPFFPQVIQAFASVFDISRDQDQLTDVDFADVGKSSMYSVFWDPEVSMVPLFAALAEITKNHLQYLASDPRKTVRHLLPLLANSHYRVREMTAEACLGFLVRKTRDLSVLEQLTRQILDVTVPCNQTVRKETDMMDGLGAALFEAMRLSSGRLHARAMEILTFALRRLQEVCAEKLPAGTPNVSECEKRVLHILSLCLSRLSRHLTKGTDVQLVALRLLKAGEDGKEDGSAGQVGNVAFLLRKWLEQRRCRAIYLLDAASLQKLLRAFSNWVGHFSCPARIVSECLGAICLILPISSNDSLWQASRQEFLLVLSKVSSSKRRESLLCAVNAVLEAYASSQRPMDTSITQAFAALCEEIAKVSAVEIFTAPSISVSAVALDRSLSLLRYLDEGPIQLASPVKKSFRVPTLETQIVSMFSHPSLSAMRDLENHPCHNIIHEGLQFLCRLQVSNGQNIIADLLGSEGLGLSCFGQLLESFCVQVEGKISHIPLSIVRNSIAVVRRLIQSVETTASSSDIAAVNKYILLFPFESKKILSEQPQQSEVLVERLSANLSSLDNNLRVHSLDLLSSLMSLLAFDKGVPMERVADDSSVRDSLPTRLKNIRSALSGDDACLTGLFQALKDTFNALRSLSLVDDTLRVLREIALVLRRSENISRIAVITLVHFSIGLLRTPFKKVWNHAGDIWSAAAGHLCHEAMTVMIQHLNDTVESIVGKRSNSPVERSPSARGHDHDIIQEDGEFQRKGVAVTSRKTTDFNSATDLVLPGRTQLNGRQVDGENAHTEVRSILSERKKVREQKVLVQWDYLAWKKLCTMSSVDGFCVVRNAKEKDRASLILAGFTDDMTFVREIVRMLCGEPQHVAPFRSQIISFYLRLDPNLFSRAAGNSLATCFSVLLEKLGGVRRGDEKSVEQLLSHRVLSDLTRSCPALQVASLRCLCASRSNALKRYRESFIRLIQNASFRDELTALAETLLPNLSFDEEGIPLDKDSSCVVEALVRICFSKMRGKADRTDSRRVAALSFIVSKLPVMIALPRIVSLVLAPVADVLDDIEESIRTRNDFVYSHQLPLLTVQMGLLTSIESIMKECHRSLDISSWLKIATSCFVLLQNAGTGNAGRNMRSRSLRILADMCRTRFDATSFFIVPVLRVMRTANFGVDGRSARGGIPGLLYFMRSVFGVIVTDVHKCIVLQEQWAVIWSLQLLGSENAEIETVESSLAVAYGLSTLILRQSDSAAEHPGMDPPMSSSYLKVASSLLCSVRALLRRLVNDILRDRTRRKSWGPVFDRVLQTLERMVESPALESEDLVAICDGLIDFLDNTVYFSGTCDRTYAVLTVIAGRLCSRRRLVDSKSTQDHLRHLRNSVLRLLPLLANVQFVNQQTSYTNFCALLANLDAPDLKAAATLLQAMNAIQPSRLDSPDLDKRIDSLNGVIKAFKEALEHSDSGSYVSKPVMLSPDGNPACVSRRIACEADALSALTYGCVASVMYDDIAIRGTASYALQLIGKWAAVSDSKTAKTCQKWVFRLLVDTVAAAKTRVVRREYTRALSEIVRWSQGIEEGDEWSGFAIFRMLKVISRPNDPDSDFFENIVHLQAHRRSRALRQLQRHILSTDMKTIVVDGMTDTTMSSFASLFSLPLAMQVALELSEETTQRFVGTRHAESREGSEKDVGVWAVATVGASARWLSFEDLRSCISNLLRRLKQCTNDKQAQISYKLLVAVVGSFPHIESTGNGSEGPIKQFLVRRLLPALLKLITVGGVEGHLVDVSTTISSKSEHEHRKSSQVFRAPVANAIALLLTRLPDSDVDTFIPRLVTPLANALRSRKTALRDSAKKALTSVVLTLGSRYFSYVIRQVLAALSEGFRQDACVYVIHSILMGVRDSAKKESMSQPEETLTIDTAAGIIAEHLSEELLRGASVIARDFEDPNASSLLRKQATLRASRAFDCAELLAEQIIFDKSVRIVLQPFQGVLANTSSAKLVSKVETLLYRMITGFAKNPSTRPRDALQICYVLVSGQCESHWRESGEGAEIPKAGEDQGQDMLKRKTKNGFSLVTFALQFLCNVVTRNAILFRGTSNESRELQAMIEPFLPLLVQALQSNHDPLTVVALRAAQKLLKLPIRNKAVTGKMMSEKIVDVLSQKAGLVTHNDELFNSCLRAAGVLMSEVGDGGFNSISKERVEALISISCKSMESGGLEARSAALVVLKAAVTSKIMIPVVYDAIERVNEMAIHSQSSSLRSSCTALSVQFAVSFPLGSKRVRQHLEFFVRNLNYELASGRLASLQVIKMIIQKFPAEVLEDECQYIFVALTASVARDSHPDCRACASQALQLLFERVPSGRSVVEMLKMAALLIGVESEMTSMGEEMRVVLADNDVQLSGAFALTTACRSGRLAIVQLSLIARVFVTVLTEHQVATHWETTYAFLHGLEVAFGSQKDVSKSEHLEVQPYTRNFWESIPSMLLHHHPWIRLASARLLGSHLSVYSDRNAPNGIRPDVPFSLLWDSKGLTREMLKSCCVQLEALSVSEELGQQCLKNLLCIANVIFKNPALGHLQGEEGELDKKVEVVSTTGSENRGLYWLLCRISGLAVRAGEHSTDMFRRGCALRFLLVTTKWWGFDFVNLHKQLYIAPIVKVLEQNASASRGPDDGSVPRTNNNPGMQLSDLKEIGNTLQDTLVSGLGGVVYYDMYHALRSERDKAKVVRKRQAAFELAVNPERAAKRRRKKAESRKMRKSHARRESLDADRERTKNSKNYLIEDL